MNDMAVRNTDDLRVFGPCWDAAGTRGMLGAGWWFHPLYRFLFTRGFDFTGSIRVEKTTTLEECRGFLPLHGPERNYQPKQFLPRCIWASPWSTETLNMVGLSGPGTRELIKMGLVSYSTEPYMLSYMSVGDSPPERIRQFRDFVKLLSAEMRFSTLFKSVNIGLQVNISCPNTGLDTKKLVGEGKEMLNIGAKLEIPLVLKINLLAPIDSILELGEHKALSGLCFTNAVPFGSKFAWAPEEEQIPWEKLFSRGSPIRRRGLSGDGGYSGPRLLPLVARYSRRLYLNGFSKPRNVGGGIRKARHVDYLVEKGRLERNKDSVFFASAAMVRPWRVQSIIRRAHKLLG